MEPQADAFEAHQAEILTGEASPAEARRGAGPLSVVTLSHQWFIACLSSELGAKAPLARVLQGVPIVLFRGEQGRPAALVDRCPHRNAPLSIGRIREDRLECAYHGWRFDGAGVCRGIPGLRADPGERLHDGPSRAEHPRSHANTPDEAPRDQAFERSARSRRAAAYAAREQDGFVWVYSTPDVEPRSDPFRFPLLTAPRYGCVRRVFEVESTLHAALENALDVPHTAFLHGGLFRTRRAPREIEVVVRRGTDRVEAEFLGEARPGGLVGRLLAPSGGEVRHVDRFLLPSIAQVEYSLGSSHLLITTAMTPVDATTTRFHAIASFRLPVPAWIVKLVMVPVATRIFRQDARILARQTETIRRFGGERFSSTEIDVLGPQIWRLLKQAEREGNPGRDAGDAAESAAVHEHRVRLTV